MIGYKGFDKDWKCRDMQYEVGKEYTHEGKSVLCKEGLHFCENPLDLFDYYPPSDSKFAEVEASGVDEKTDSDSKRVAKTLKIKAELGLGALIGLGIKFIFDKIEWTKENSATGDQAGAQATGNRAGAQATGNQAGAQATGNRAGAQATGNRAGAQATGEQAGAQATGNRAGAQATGNRAGAQATGNWAVATSVGNESSATISKGEKLAEGCAGAFGINGKAKGDKGCWLTLSEWKKDENKDWHRIDVKTKRVDGKKIKEDTFYQLIAGKFTEAK